MTQEKNKLCYRRLDMNVAEYYREQNSSKGKKNRDDGMKFEWRVASSFKRRSDVLFICNSKGSRGKVDVLVQFKNGTQFWITCKSNAYLTPSERRGIDKLISSKPENVSIYLYSKNFINGRIVRQKLS